MKQKYEFVGAAVHPCDCPHYCGAWYRSYVWKWLVPATATTNTYYEVATIDEDDFWDGEPRFNYYMKTLQEGVHL